MRKFAAGIVTLLALAAYLGAGSATAATEELPCMEAGFPIEGVHVTRVETKAPNSPTWVNQVEGTACATTNIDNPGEVEVDGLFTEYLPEGTKLRVTVKSDTFAPLYTAGNFEQGQTSFNGDELTVTGSLLYYALPANFGEECEEGEEKQPFFTFLVDLDNGDPAREAYAGSYFYSNAYEVVPQIADAGKAIELSVSGCGDNSPSTVDGAVHGFIPDSSATLLGIPPSMVAKLTAPVAGQLLQVTNNGQPTNTGMALERVPGGLALRYSLSFSQHRIAIKAKPSAIALGRHCAKAHGHLKVKPLPHKTRQSRLVCVH